MNSASLYLQKLKYDKGLEKKAFYHYITNVRFVTLLILSILVVGVFSYLGLARRFMPEIKIPVVVVSTVLPGAGPEDVESLITDPLEKEILSLDGVEKVTSTSQENASIVKVEFNSRFNPDKAVTDVQQAVDKVVDLPEDALEPKVVLVDFEDVPIWTFALTSTKDEASLMTLTDELVDKIEALPSVDRVELNGQEELQAQVIVDLEKLQQYRLNPVKLAEIINSQLKSYPAGNVKTDSNSFSVTLDSTIQTVEDLRDLSLDLGPTHPVVAPQNPSQATQVNPAMTPPAQVALGDIAQVIELPKDQISQTYVIDAAGQPKRAVSFSVYKRVNQSIEDVYDQVRQVVDDQLRSYPEQFELIDVDNSAKKIQDQFDTLTSNFISTLILVFVVLVVFLGLRQASVVAFSIPLTFLVAFSVMKLSGLSLNFLTMFSLLLALGLVVDDAIVIVSAMTRYHLTGKFDSKQTGALVWRDYIIPIWSTTITTVWAFIPLLLATGIIGEFIKSIPIVVSTTLLASTSVAVLITLPLMIVFLKPRLPNRVKLFFYSLIIFFLGAVLVLLVGKSPILPLAILTYTLLVIAFRLVIKDRRKQKKRSLTVWNFILKHPKLKSFWQRMSTGFINLETLSFKYKRFILKTIKSKSAWTTVLIIVVGFSIFSYFLVPLGFVENEFFPKENQNTIYIQLTMPSGTRQEVTQEQALQLAQKIIPSSDYQQFGRGLLVEVGKTFSGSKLTTGGSSANQALISVLLVDKDERKKTSLEISQDLRFLLKDFTLGKIMIKEVSGGPPVGADLEIRVMGEDLDQVNLYADKLVDYMKQMPGVYDVDKSVKQSISKITFAPDEAKLRELELTNKEVGFWLRTFASGFDLGVLDKNDEPIVLKTTDQVQTPEDIDRIYLPTQRGYLPLSALGHLTLTQNPSVIYHEDGDRVINVFGTVSKGYATTTLSRQLEAYARTELNLPEGYSFKAGGANEENKKSVKSILQAMVLAALLIIVTMVIQLGSFRRSLIVFMVIPLAISGVFIIFALTNTPLSFPALIGLLALFGIVVNNSIMLVEKIRQNELSGMSLESAIADASASRLEPIALSSLTTIMGLVPITISDPVWRGLGGAIISGLLFSGSVMLLFIPVLYYVMYRNQE